jgi:MoxR-like ATPase
MRHTGMVGEVLCPVLVGRRAEIQALESALAGVLAGRGGCAVITGEAGIGKSRLIRELARMAAGRHVPVVMGRRSPAAVEDIDFRHPRGLDRAHILSLAQAHWASNRRAIVITGPTGSGKTYLACALARAAIRNGHTALYQRAPRMLDELAIARSDGRLARLLAT